MSLRYLNFSKWFGLTSRCQGIKFYIQFLKFWGQELVIIKYYGTKPDGVELIGKGIENCDYIVGVERQFSAKGITHQGQGIFDVSENRYGMWLNPKTHVAKIIQPIVHLKTKWKSWCILCIWGIASTSSGMKGCLASLMILWCVRLNCSFWWKVLFFHNFLDWRNFVMS